MTVITVVFMVNYVLGLLKNLAFLYDKYYNTVRVKPFGCSGFMLDLCSPQTRSSGFFFALIRKSLNF